MHQMLEKRKTLRMLDCWKRRIRLRMMMWKVWMTTREPTIALDWISYTLLIMKIDILVWICQGA